MLAAMQKLINHRPSVTLKVNTEWHWQAVKDGKVLIDIWPTKFKYRQVWPVSKKTVECRGQTQLLRDVADILKYHVPNKREQPQTQQRDQPGEGPEQVDPVSTEVRWFVSSARRMVGADMVLEGTQLRLILNGTYFSDSFRLNSADTLLFLQNAATLLRELPREVPVE